MRQLDSRSQVETVVVAPSPLEGWSRSLDSASNERLVEVYEELSRRHAEAIREIEVTRPSLLLVGLKFVKRIRELGGEMRVRTTVYRAHPDGTGIRRVTEGP